MIARAEERVGDLNPLDRVDGVEECLADICVIGDEIFCDLAEGSLNLIAFVVLQLVDEEADVVDRLDGCVGSCRALGEVGGDVEGDEQCLNAGK